MLWDPQSCGRYAYLFETIEIILLPGLLSCIPHTSQCGGPNPRVAVGNRGHDHTWSQATACAMGMGHKELSDGIPRQDSKVY